MGLVWLFSTWRPLRGSVAASVGSGVNALSETTAAAGEKVSAAAASLRRSATDFVPAVNRDLLTDARSALGEMLYQQPLLLGAMGLAIGAGIAASLPITKTEADFLGETSANLQEKARA